MMGRSSMHRRSPTVKAGESRVAAAGSSTGLSIGLADTGISSASCWVPWPSSAAGDPVAWRRARVRARAVAGLARRG